MVRNKQEEQLTVRGCLYARVDFGLLMALGSIHVPTHIVAYLLYCHLNSGHKPWFFADPDSRPTFNVTDRTLRRWLSRMDEGGIIELAPKKKGRWPKLRFNATKGIPCGSRIGPGGILEKRA